MIKKIYAISGHLRRLILLLPVLVAVQAEGQALTRRDTDEIRILAREKIKGLNDLMNAVANEDLSSFERRYLILNSYMPSNDQVFFNDGVIAEDDIDPKNTTTAPGLDLPIEKYLGNFDLFYTKSEKNSVEFTGLVVSDVKVGEYPFVKVFFTSHFRGKYKTTDALYKPVTRVAEMRASRVGNEWLLFITRLAFHTSGISQAVPGLPQASVGYGAGNKENTTMDKYAREDAKTGERVSQDMKKASAHKSFLSSNMGIIKLSAGVAALAFGAVTYGMLNKDYKDYKSRIDKPEGLMQYAKPGIYISVGCAAVGVGISLSSVLDFNKAKR